jgi:hypothetical protein
MAVQYLCASEHRRHDVAAGGQLNGIDYLEVDAGQTVLTVHFLQTLPGGGANPIPPAPPLAAINVVIEGGVRIKPIMVQALSAAGSTLTVMVDRPGDFSTYTLRLRTSDIDERPPAGFDPVLTRIDFSFKAGCETDFDCVTEEACARPLLPEPEIDYQARDFASFRRLMLDRLAVISPQWPERSPADLGIVLVELLAYLGDELAYTQDAVATEAYLRTARRRVSVRRHARLLDYRLHDGTNARAWVRFTVSAGAPDIVLKEKTVLLSKGGTGAVIPPGALDNVLKLERPTVFETLQEITLRAAHNRFRFYTWSDTDCCLPRGSTRATLRRETASSLAKNDALVFEEVKGPGTGAEADADPLHRHVVKLTAVTPTTDPATGTNIIEIAWGREDALPFPLCLSATLAGQGIMDISVALGNVVLADHGQTIQSGDLSPNQAPQTGPYRPRLRTGPITFAAPAPAAGDPAAAVLATDPQRARATVELHDGSGHWSPVFDLLDSNPFDANVVVEAEADGTASIRFGDGVHGRTPEPGTTMTVDYRIGNGVVGNVGAGVIGRVVLVGGGIDQLDNPLAAVGGVDPESIERAKQLAPEAFRTPRRAVTEGDYADIVGQLPGVQRAAATFRWTGSWYTAFVTVDPQGQEELDPQLKSRVSDAIESYRMAGWDVELNSPEFVPLDVALTVCVAPGYFRSHVRKALDQRLGSRRLPDGSLGFFHPDNFTFGQPVFLSQLSKAALDVPGVQSLTVDALRRWGSASTTALQQGQLTPGPFQILRCDSDPNFPERGQVTLTMAGGL